MSGRLEVYAVVVFAFLLALLIAIGGTMMSKAEAAATGKAASTDVWFGGAAGNVIRIHDHETRVTCWLYRAYKGGGISCLPDSQVSHR